MFDQNAISILINITLAKFCIQNEGTTFLNLKT